MKILMGIFAFIIFARGVFQKKIPGKIFGKFYKGCVLFILCI